MTALGLYEAHLNGVRVGRDQFAPGWTDYRTRVQYQVHDVTELVRSGGNALGVFLAPGWYAGNVGMFGPHQYGERPALLVQLEVEYGGGSAQRVVSDTGWSVSGAGPVVGADLLGGESYDARGERPGWGLPGFEDAGWLPAVQVEGVVSGRVVAQVGAPVRVAQELTPVGVSEPRPGVFVFDLGQNMVGSVWLRVVGAAGMVVRLWHAEVLQRDGIRVYGELAYRDGDCVHVVPSKWWVVRVASVDRVRHAGGVRVVRRKGVDVADVHLSGRPAVSRVLSA